MYVYSSSYRQAFVQTQHDACSPHNISALTAGCQLTGRRGFRGLNPREGDQGFSPREEGQGVEPQTGDEGIQPPGRGGKGLSPYPCSFDNP